MAKFTFKEKQAQIKAKEIPKMKHGFRLKKLLYTLQQWVVLGLLIYIAIKVS
jgi:hypothetical protein